VDISGLISATQARKKIENESKKRKKERNVMFCYYAVAMFLSNRKSSLIDIKESKRRGINKPNINNSCCLFLSLSSKFLNFSKKVPDCVCLKCHFTRFAQHTLFKPWSLVFCIP